jgi:DNA ligase-1
MRDFARLVWDLDDAKDSGDRLRLLTGYFATNTDEDKAWALKLLLDRPAKKIVSSKVLKETALKSSGLPNWLFDRSVADVGDIAEAAALLCDLQTEQSGCDSNLSQWIQDRVQPLANMDEARQSAALIEAWSQLDSEGRFVFNKLVLGLLRPPVTREEVIEAYARFRQIPPWAVHLRLEDTWTSSLANYSQFCSTVLTDVERHKPYRLCTVSKLDSEIDPSRWLAEPKLDGIRVQAIRRAGKNSLWLKSESLVSDRFPEIRNTMDSLPDGTVLDGVIVAWTDGKPQPSSTLVSRLERKPAVKRAEAQPNLVFIAFDILEFDGEDVRGRPFHERRELLEQISSEAIVLAESNPAVDLGRQLEEARVAGADGLILKRLHSCYGRNPDEDTWLVLKSESKTLAGVLMYVERGAAGQIEQVTVGVWRGEELIPIAKVPAVFSTDEATSIEAFVKENTLERFGPVRTVRPAIVIEIAYDGVEPASRRKAGIALRTPRIVGIRGDLAAESADHINSHWAGGLQSA